MLILAAGGMIPYLSSVGGGAQITGLGGGITDYGMIFHIQED